MIVWDYIIAEKQWYFVKTKMILILKLFRELYKSFAEIDINKLNLLK